MKFYNKKTGQIKNLIFVLMSVRIEIIYYFRKYLKLFITNIERY